MPQLILYCIMIFFNVNGVFTIINRVVACHRKPQVLLGVLCQEDGTEKYF